MRYTDEEVEKLAPCVGNYGFYSEYVLPEDCRPVGDDYMDEQWAPIKESDNYWVSTCGRVWSALSNRFIKPKHLDNHGHVGISIWRGKDEKPLYRYLHRLMAEAFLFHEDDQDIVRHLNDDSKCNWIENLEWGTQKDNMRDCIENENFYYITNEDREKGLAKARIPTIAVDKDGNEQLFDSMKEAARQLNVSQANIWKVLNGERRTAGGYRFKRGVKE